MNHALSDRRRKIFHYYSIMVFNFVAYLKAGVYVSAQDINFRHLKIDNGLRQNALSLIFQDCRGYIWFGISAQFVREKCGRGVPAKTCNPEEERSAGIWTGLSFTNEVLKHARLNYCRSERTIKSPDLH